MKDYMQSGAVIARFSINDIAHGSVVSEAERKSEFKLTKNIP